MYIVCKIPIVAVNTSILYDSAFDQPAVMTRWYTTLLSRTRNRRSQKHWFSIRCSFIWYPTLGRRESMDKRIPISTNAILSTNSVLAVDGAKFLKFQKSKK